MTLLTICQAAARQVGITVPSAVAAGTSPEAIDLLAFARREGRTLADSHDWTILQREHTFATAAGTPDYALPSDFGRLLTQTAWDRENYRLMRGPLTPAQWQVRKSALVGSSNLWKQFRIFPVAAVNRFKIDPTPAAVDDLVFEYVSNAWCQSAGGTAQSSWAADDDVARIDENLIELGVVWRLLARLGRAYAEERAEYDNEVMKAKARDGGMARLSLDQRPRRPDDSLTDIAGQTPTWGGMGGAKWGSMGG